MSPVLEVSIGTILVFLVVAVIVSTITEAVSGMLKVRAKMLERGVEVMLGQGTKDWLYYLPLIATSTPPGRHQGRPSYIDAVNFSTSVIGQLSAPTNQTLLAAILPAAASTRRRNVQTALVGLNAITNEAARHNYSADTLSRYLLDRVQSGPRSITAHHVALITGSLDDVKTVIGNLAATDPARAPLQDMLNASPPPQTTEDVLAGIIAYGSPANLPSLAHMIGGARGVGLSSKALNALNQLAQGADGDVVTFRESIEDWFDREMDRVSGAYKRWSQVVMFVIALALAIGANISAYSVGRALWLDPSLRAQAVATAQQSISSTIRPPTTALSSGTAATSPPAPTYQQLRSLGMPIGWSRSNWPEASDIGDIILVAVGWLIIAVASSMGSSPLWFDTLNKFVNLRASGPRPDRAAVQRANDTGVRRHVRIAVKDTIDEALSPVPPINMEGAIEVTFRRLTEDRATLEIDLRIGPTARTEAIGRGDSAGLATFIVSGGRYQSDVPIEVILDLPAGLEVETLDSLDDILPTEEGRREWSIPVSGRSPVDRDIWVSLYSVGRFVQAVPAAVTGG